MVSVAIRFSNDFKWEDRRIERLKRDFPQVVWTVLRGEADEAEHLKDVEALIGEPTDEALAVMPKLRWIQWPWAGVEALTGFSRLKDDVVVTNTSGVFGSQGAEHALALMLAFARRLHLYVRQQERAVWKTAGPCREVRDSTVLVLGLGDIGSEVAARAKALGAHVIGVKRSVAGKPPFVDELIGPDDVDKVIGKADFVVNALPLTRETERFVSAERIAAMKRGAVFVNVGRGATVDEEALVRALEGGHLDGAGLDVTEREPLPADHPLWRLPNVILTCHTMGLSPKKEDRREKLIRDNLSRFLAGEPLMNVVDRRRGY